MYKDFAQFVFFIKLILFFNFCDIMLYYNNSHGQNEVNQVKKKTLVPLITFLLGICLISLIVYKTDTHEKEQRHITAQLNVATYGERIKNEITNGIEITNTLKQILISENGEIHMGSGFCSLILQKPLRISRRCFKWKSDIDEMFRHKGFRQRMLPADQPGIKFSVQ